MQQNIDLALQYSRMAWSYRWLALVVAVLLSGSGWAYVLLLPDQFEVESKVFLDTRSMLRPVLKGLAVDSSADVDTTLLMRRTLLVRPNLETVARKTDMDLQAKTPEDFERLLIALAKKIRVSGTSKDNIFVIAYADRDPELAAKVVDALLQIFVEKSLGDTRKDTSKTKQFVERQIAEYEARLIAAEERLKQFKRQNIDVMSNSNTGYYQRLTQVAESLSNARLNLQEAEHRRDGLKAQLANVSQMLSVPGPETAAPAEASPLDLRISELERTLDALLLNFTDKHPDVVAARRVLAELEAERDASTDEPEPQAATEARRAENPMFQDLTIQLSEVEGEVAAMGARADEYERRQQELRKLIDTVPQVEAELQKLNRDYTVNQSQYEELVRRREALKLSDEAGQTTDDVRFNVLEPARVPLVPVGPDRPLFSAGVFVASLGAGLGIALLVALLRPTVYSKESFAELTDLPVLGAVSRFWTPRERFRRRMAVATFATACLGLFAAFGALMALYQLDVDLVGRVAELTERLS